MNRNIAGFAVALCSILCSVYALTAICCKVEISIRGHHLDATVIIQVVLTTWRWSHHG